MPIEKPEEFRSWLAKQSQDTSVLITARAALRAFPFVTHDERAANRITLAAARAILSSMVEVKMPTPESMPVAWALDFSRQTSSGAVGSANAAATAHSAAEFAADASHPVTFRILATNRIADSAQSFSNAGEAVFATYYKDSELELDALFFAPIWHSLGEPDWLKEGLSNHEDILESGPEWTFWREWYLGFLDGKPMDWELQRRVALIEDAIWKAGPEAVSEEIERIRARYDVETALNDLAAEQSVIQTSRLGIGGNNPPEAIEDAPVIERHVTLIWNGVDILAEEAKAEAPDKTRVETALGMLKTGLAACLKWCARKGDLAVDTLIKWGVPVGGSGYLALNPDKVRALIEAVEAWVPFL